MSKKVALVGHCGADASYLKIAVSRAAKDAKILALDDQAELNEQLNEGVDLVLVNRILDWGFSTDQGIELIQQLHEKHPNVKWMLVSNHEQAQAAAIAAGAAPGFGKRGIGTPQVTEQLKAALG